jgi:hypothetical protein
MGKKRVLVGYGVDIDAVAGWLGSYGGEDSSSDISRGKTFLHKANSRGVVTRKSVNPDMLKKQRSLCRHRRHTTPAKAV